jgi:hypothetical protein
MATAYKIKLKTGDVGSFHTAPYSEEAAAKASELLQRNNEDWDIIFSGLRHSQY